MSTKQKVCVLGSGNWGSAIAKVIASNTVRLDSFDSCVNLWVYEEMVDGKKLTDIINTTHENVKYLPGIILPENVVAVADAAEAAKDADILVFCIPHQFIPEVCSILEGSIKPTTMALSLVKEFNVSKSGEISLVSQIIQKHLKIEVSVLMGANLANEIADEKFSETTIGCRNKEIGQVLKDVIQTDYFHVSVVDDVEAVEACSALRNIVAVGAGFVDGLKLGDNTKAAIIRIGLMEIIKFVDTFYSGARIGTFLESCGVADLITACYGGRNRKISEAYVTSKKSFGEVENELLNGKKLHGPIVAAEVNFMLKSKNMEKDFPLFTTVHKICIAELEPSDLIEQIK